MTDLDNKDELIKSSADAIIAKAKNKSQLCYICSCKLGSPVPGKVILVPTLHENTCRIRRKLASSDYTTEEAFLI
jgi:hypothetical protein